MILVVEITSIVLTLIVGFPMVIVCIECIAALLPLRGNQHGERGSVTVLIPAHNEASVIAETVTSLQSQLSDSDSILVVADNCNDQTAELATRAGAQVVERFDSDKRGKGFALDYGVRALRKDPPEVVVVFDADCTAEGGMVGRLSRCVMHYRRPAQGLYLMKPPDDGGPEAVVSAFAFLVKNWVRPRGLQRLGQPVMLTGSGMAFPWALLEKQELANNEIVEDLALGLKLTRDGYGPIFCEDAKIWSCLPGNEDAAIVQRTRWEHGYLGIMSRTIPSLMKETVCGNWRTLLPAVDLCVPPLSLLVLVDLLVVFVVFLFAAWLGIWSPFYFLAVINAMFFCIVGISWFAFARSLIPMTTLNKVPTYVLRKVTIYMNYLVNREKEWKRTRRDLDPAADDQS